MQMGQIIYDYVAKLSLPHFVSSIYCKPPDAHRKWVPEGPYPKVQGGNQGVLETLVPTVENGFTPTCVMLGGPNPGMKGSSSQHRRRGLSEEDRYCSVPRGDDGNSSI